MPVSTYVSGPAGAVQPAPTNATAPQNAPTSVPPQMAAPPVVVDIDLDDIPEEPFSARTFRLGGVVYTLVLRDDHLLSQLAEEQRDGDLDLDSLHAYFFEQTFSSAMDSAGNPVPEGVQRLLAELAAVDERGIRRVSLRKTQMIVESAIEQWADELTDRSMRPVNRAQRRGRQDRRRR